MAKFSERMHCIKMDTLRFERLAMEELSIDEWTAKEFVKYYLDTLLGIGFLQIKIDPTPLTLLVRCYTEHAGEWECHQFMDTIRRIFKRFMGNVDALHVMDYIIRQHSFIITYRY